MGERYAKMQACAHAHTHMHTCWPRGSCVGVTEAAVGAGAVKRELYELFAYAWPVVSTMVMFYLATIVTMAFVGTV